jgi:hypothetical protein
MSSMSQELNMKKQLASIYDQLGTLRIDQHARDFWRMRASKQKQQVLEDPLLHEFTALKQYTLWHNKNGVRLPSFARGTEQCIAGSLGMK